MFINAHVHSPIANESILAIENICIETLSPIHVASIHYSIGIHPWHISSILQSHSIEEVNCWFDTVFDVHVTQNSCCIGEIGLDKCIETPLELQSKIFEKQLNIAQKHKRPILIHCVKAYNEIVELLGKNNVNTPVVFHGFNGSEQLAQQLIRKGYFLSLGKQLLINNRTKFIALLKQIPVQQLVFESDEHPNIEIISVYNMATDIVGNDLVAKITSNKFCNFFISNNVQ